MHKLHLFLTSVVTVGVCFKWLSFVSIMVLLQGEVFVYFMYYLN